VSLPPTLAEEGPLGQRKKSCGLKKNTVLAYLSRRNFKHIPRPNRKLARGPLWFEGSVKEWEAKGDIGDG
jgi:hypothetical protein